MPVWFHSEIDYQISSKRKLKNWVYRIIDNHGRLPGTINYIFMDDEMLLEINKQYLNHNYYTDIISFDYSGNNLIAGDIYISIDRVRENALENNADFDNELFRVMAHGILHFLGFKDKNQDDKKKMRDAENACLKLLKQA